VTPEPPTCDGYKADVFALSDTPDIIDLNNDDGLKKLVALLENTSLYQVNMELALDRALCERHKNALVRVAIGKAFAGKALPSTLQKDEKFGPEELSGDLHHPMLGHADLYDLCKMYVAFLNAMGSEQTDYSFGKDIIGSHPDRFLDFYDGFIMGSAGAMRADTLLALGMRGDHDPARALDTYRESGQKKAQDMDLSEPQDMIWAWLEADHYQMRRCADLHRLLQLPNLACCPHWARADVFCLLEHEAMKQVFAHQIVNTDVAMGVLETMPSVKKAVQSSDADDVDGRLQALLAQVLNEESVYTGAADEFARAAYERAAEAQKIQLES